MMCRRQGASVSMGSTPVPRVPWGRSVRMESLSAARSRVAKVWETLRAHAARGVAGVSDRCECVDRWSGHDRGPYLLGLFFDCERLVHLDLSEPLLDVPVVLNAVASVLTGETIGDSSQFQAIVPGLQGRSRFEGKLRSIRVRGAPFENVAVSYPDGTAEEAP